MTAWYDFTTGQIAELGANRRARYHAELAETLVEATDADDVYMGRIPINLTAAGIHAQLATAWALISQGANQA